MKMLRVVSAAVIALSIAGCIPQSEKPDRPGQTLEPKLVMKPSSFGSLDGWQGFSSSSVYSAFRASCRAIVVRTPNVPLGGNTVYGNVDDWVGVCQAALATTPKTGLEVRSFFETWFAPVQVFNGDEPHGLFTGYYEPELSGSRTRSDRFRTPLHQRPPDLVEVDLGQFRPNLRGERVAGRVAGGRLVPYAARREILAQGLGLQPLVFVDDPVAAFFLQIQGSGRIKLDNGEIIRAAYDGQNGHAYTAVGRVLVDRGEISREALSMQSIRAWLESNPEQADALMNENASYVFFKAQPIGDPSKGADGAQGVPLTAEASLAVDLRFHALGVPMWVEGRAPNDQDTGPDVDLRHLFIAQDTGGAIRGPIRGDIYWGTGSKAESVAGRMAHKGRLYALLPKPLAQRLR